MLNIALELSNKIRNNNREKRGSIDFDKAESKIVDENGKVQDIILRDRGKAEKILKTLCRC